ncbi:MAG: hypothetical protein AAFY72_18725, partial [Cyanobacteria bacterium J06649_4]
AKAHCQRTTLLRKCCLPGFLTFSWLSPHPIVNGIGLFFLTVSYWCVYEVGYQENDRMGEKYEHQPSLSENYVRYNKQINLNTPLPWCWAIALAVPGLCLVALSRLDMAFVFNVSNILEQLALLPQSLFVELSTALLRDTAIWVAFLISVRLTFWLYNQFDEATRLWVYPFLQTQRMFCFTLLLSTNAVGAVLLLSLVLARWIQYCVYRCGGDRTKLPPNVSCTLIFTLLLAMVAISHPEPTNTMIVQAAIAFSYCLIRSVGTIRRIFSQFQLLRHSQ